MVQCVMHIQMVTLLHGDTRIYVYTYFVILPWYSFEVYPAEQYGEHYPVIMEHTSSNTVVHKLQNKIHDMFRSQLSSNRFYFSQPLNLIVTGSLNATSSTKLGNMLGISGYADVSRVTSQY